MEMPPESPGERIDRILDEAGWPRARRKVATQMRGLASSARGTTRSFKVLSAHLHDEQLETMSLVERIEADALPEDGVVTSREIYEGLDLPE